MAKKTRTLDTASGAVNMMSAAAAGLPDIPAHIHVRKEDEPFLRAILLSRPRDEWNAMEIAVANDLAWTQTEIAVNKIKLQQEGTTILNERGTMVTNPRFRAISELKSSQLAVMKALALHSAGGTDIRETTKRRKALTKTQTLVNDLKDSLIPAD